MIGDGWGCLWSVTGGGVYDRWRVVVPMIGDGWGCVWSVMGGGGNPVQPELLSVYHDRRVTYSIESLVPVSVHLRSNMPVPSADTHTHTHTHCTEQQTHLTTISERQPRVSTGIRTVSCSRCACGAASQGSALLLTLLPVCADPVLKSTGCYASRQYYRNGTLTVSK